MLALRFPEFVIVTSSVLLFPRMTDPKLMVVLAVAPTSSRLPAASCLLLLSGVLIDAPTSAVCPANAEPEIKHTSNANRSVGPVIATEADLRWM
jgi:hypothetical protein